VAQGRLDARSCATPTAGRKIKRRRPAQAREETVKIAKNHNDAIETAADGRPQPTIRVTKLDSTSPGRRQVASPLRQFKKNMRGASRRPYRIEINRSLEQPQLAAGTRFGDPTLAAQYRSR